MANRDIQLGFATNGFTRATTNRARSTESRGNTRRGPDPKTSEAFAKIHSMRDRFSVSAVTEALLKARKNKAE